MAYEELVEDEADDEEIKVPHTLHTLRITRLTYFHILNMIFHNEDYPHHQR